MDAEHLQRAEKTYFEISELFPDFISVKCTKNGKIMTKKEIGDIVWNRVVDII